MLIWSLPGVFYANMERLGRVHANIQLVGVAYADLHYMGVVYGNFLAEGVAYANTQLVGVAMLICRHVGVVHANERPSRRRRCGSEAPARGAVPILMPAQSGRGLC